MPRVTSFVELILITDRIQSAICGLYEDLIRFFIEATIFLKRHPIVNILRVVWPCKERRGFQDSFASLFNSIQAHTTWIDTEANVGLHLATQQLASRKYDEIMASIATIRSPVPMSSLNSVKYRIIPWVANPQFFGRVVELEKLSSLLSANQRANHSVVSIIGEAGVGKSQLALQFSYSHLSEYDAIFWIQAETPLKLAQSYEKIALEVGLMPGSGSSSSENTATLESNREVTKRWLSTTDHSWLLIYDNVESAQTLEGYWPTGHGRQGSIILTTRDQNLTQPPISGSIRLRCFDEREGAKFLLDNISPNNISAHDTLSQVLRYALALDVPLPELQSLCSSPNTFIDSGSELNQLAQLDHHYYPMSSSALWEHSFLSLGQAGKKLAQFLAHLDPDTIPKDLMGIRSNTTIQQQLGITTVDENLLELLRQSLLSGGSTSHDYSMHRLLQAAILHRSSLEDTINSFEMAVGLIDESFPDYDESDRLLDSWPKCKDVLPHVVRLSELYSGSVLYPMSTYLVLGQLLKRAAWYLVERVALSDSNTLLHVASDVCRKGLEITGSSGTRASSLEEITRDLKKLRSDVSNSLGRLCMQLGKCDQALEHFLDAIATRGSLGELDKELIYMKRNVAYGYLSQGRPQQALPVLEEASKMADELFISQPNLTVYQNSYANSLGLMSTTFLMLGQLDDAWNAALKSTELIKALTGPESSLATDCYITLGETRKCQGLLDEAEAFIRKAVDIRSASSGSSQGTAAALHAYGVLLGLKGSDEALYVMEQAIKMFRKVPDSKLLLARSLFQYAKLQNAHNDNATHASREEAMAILDEHRIQTESSSRTVTSVASESQFEEAIPFWYRSFGIQATKDKHELRPSA
ncbi:hypothetical protein B0T21DRAFT_353699 [Apiosordaria backusii]|uniref:NB-ARC domain-containing protein n=1 Tax=Apiosordaria backusii TaxID=314023 RepID=A0AA40DHD3_9PEZI|nr:hypothetical protein B0T21DRAFT_353699 [Apiosordaria backusii]